MEGIVADLQSTIIDNRQAVEAFIAAAHAVPQSAWAQPRAPRKWSPGQVTEHVAIVYEGARAILDGTFAGRAAPRVMRPLIRAFALNPILKTGRFKTGLRAPAFFQPTSSTASVDDLSARLRQAAGAFAAAVETAAGQGMTFVDHPFFGRVDLADYSRLQAIHTRHHAQQLGTGTERPATV
jgi:DinB family protein